MPLPTPIPLFLIPFHLRKLALTWRHVRPHAPLSRAALIVVCGSPAAARLDAIRATHASGGYPDDCLPHLDTRRLAFARWLISHGRLTDGDIP